MDFLFRRLRGSENSILILRRFPARGNSSHVWHRVGTSDVYGRVSASPSVEIHQNGRTIMRAADGTENSQPQIVENYRDFVPPPKLKKLIEELLRSVPQNYLKGLKTIVLTNQTALTRNQRRQKIWNRKTKYRLAEARGAYYRSTPSSPATIWLYVDNILHSMPSWWFRIPLLRVDPFATVLFHEIGHHIHAVHKPIYEGKENVAEDWSKRLCHRCYRRRYWYLVPFLYPVITPINLARKIKKKTSRRIAQRD